MTLGKQLGEGAFGQVVKAEGLDICNKKGSTTVAVKMLKGESLSVINTRHYLHTLLVTGL